VGSFVNNFCPLVFLEKHCIKSTMTQKTLLIPIIAVLFAVGIQQAYAEIDQNEVPFDFDFKSCQGSTLVTEAGDFDAWYCTYLGGIPVGATIEETVTEDGVTFEVRLGEELGLGEEETPVTTEPILRPEQKEKVEGIYTAQQVIEDYGAGELDVQEFCFGGTVKENTIYYPDTDTTINIKTPNDNVQLSTHQQFKYEHLMSEICKSEYILANKVHNASRTPQGTGGTKFIVTATLPEDAQAKYDEAKMGDYFAQKTKNDAEDYKCTKEGKARGLGFDCKVEEDQVIPETTISTQGQAIKNKYRAYLETGITDIPKQEPDAEPTKESIARQYLKAAGYSDEQIDAAIAAMEDDSNE